MLIVLSSLPSAEECVAVSCVCFAVQCVSKTVVLLLESKWVTVSLEPSVLSGFFFPSFLHGCVFFFFFLLAGEAVGGSSLTPASRSILGPIDIHVTGCD